MADFPEDMVQRVAWQRRPALDALEIAGVIEGDARVCDLHASKRYIGPAVALTVPGALITVTRLAPKVGS